MSILLSKREELLLKAFKELGTVSIREMSETLEVSTRTVYRSLADLALTLKSQGITIEKEGKSYFLSGHLESLDEFIVLESYGQRQRLYEIAYLLLSQNTWLTNEELQERLSVSHMTIIQDIATIEKRFLDFDLHLDRKKGYRLVGSANDRRRLLAVLLVESLDVIDFFQGKIQNQASLDQKLIQYLIPLFDKYSQDLGAMDIKIKMYFILHLALVDNQAESVGTNHISKKALELSQELFQEYASWKGSYFTIQEILNFAAALDEYLLRRQENPLYLDEFDSQFYYTVSKLVDTVSAQTHIDFFKDQKLFRSLFHHIRLSLVLPVLFPSSDFPSFLQNLVERNRGLEEVLAGEIVRLLPNYLQNEYERSMLTLHFVSSLRRSPDLSPISLLLLTADNRVMRDLLLSKIKSVAPFVGQVILLHPEEWREQSMMEVDAYLTTKRMSDERFYYISSFPSTEELLKLQTHLEWAQEHRSIRLVEGAAGAASRHLNLESYLDASREILQHFKLEQIHGALDFPQAVKQIVAKQDEVADKEALLSRLLERFEISPLAIPQTNLALVHAQTEDVTESIFRIYQLEQAVEARSMDQNMEKVQRILLMVSPQDVSQESRQLMTVISQSLIENRLYTEIYRTGNQDILYQLLNTIFNEEIKKVEK